MRVNREKDYRPPQAKGKALDVNGIAEVQNEFGAIVNRCAGIDRPSHFDLRYRELEWKESNDMHGARRKKKFETPTVDYVADRSY